ncbi:MAG: RAMP superfamily CRISPR-associated protein [Actinomycetota bacterium]
MSWDAYKLTFRMQSPLHSGYAKVGNIQQTRLYVTGRMLWGALTSQITRLKDSTNYVQVGKDVQNYLRTSYFFPCLDREGNRPILPQVQNHQSGYSVDCVYLKASKVERWLATSYASTAINKDTLAAEEGSLHEVELISHHFLNNVNENGISINAGDLVYLTGVFFVSKDAPDDLKNSWKKIIKSFQVGGERGYGFGRLSLLDEHHPTKKLFGYGLNLSGNDPCVLVSENNPVLAHTVAEDDLKMEGILEPFLGRETSEDGQFGKRLSEVKPCWAPGAVTRKSTSFFIKEKGIWEVQI